MFESLFGRRPPETNPEGLRRKNQELLNELKRERKLRRELERQLAEQEEQE